MTMRNHECIFVSFCMAGVAARPTAEQEEARAKVARERVEAAEAAAVA